MIYSFKASGDYAPTFQKFWRSRVHPEDLPGVEAAQAKLFSEGRHVAEYRFRKSDGIYC